MKKQSVLRGMNAGFPLVAANSANYLMSSIAVADHPGLGAATDHRRAGARLQV